MYDVQQELENLKRSGNHRSLEFNTGICFGSNDYLGLSQDDEIRKGLIEFLKYQPQLGSTGSRLLSGHSPHLLEVEDELANAFDAEACLIFGSGYLASLGVCAALDSNETSFFSDEWIHASWIDGLRLARGSKHIFRHADLQALELALSSSVAKRKVILTEGIFSMDGDCADLESLFKIAQNHDAYLIVDEAHSTGVLGLTGKGAISLQSSATCRKERIIAVHTAGKALGGYGAFVCTSGEIKELMVNKSRALIYTTAPSPVGIEQIRISVRKLLGTPSLMQRLWQSIRFTQSEFTILNLPHSGTQIIPIIIGDDPRASRTAELLQARGIGIRAVRTPTVPRGRARLRISLSARHSHDDLVQLVKAIGTLREDGLL